MCSRPPPVISVERTQERVPEGLGRAVAVGAEHERDVHVAALRAGLAGVDDGVVLGRDGGVDGHGACGVGRDGHARIADEYLAAPRRP